MEVEVISVIKSCIASSKGGIPLVDIDGDYRELMGESIPYQKFGYQTLGNFIAGIPGIKMNKTKNGTVLTADDEKIAHLTALIEKQKTAAPKKKKKSFLKISPKSKNVEHIAGRKKKRLKSSFNKENVGFSENVPHGYAEYEVPGNRQGLYVGSSGNTSQERKYQFRDRLHDSESDKAPYSYQERDLWSSSSYQDCLSEYARYCEKWRHHKLDKSPNIYYSYYRTTKIVDNVLKVTVDNTSNSAGSSNDSVQFIDVDEDLYAAVCTAVDVYNKSSPRMESSPEPMDEQYSFEPTLFNHQMIGDDFFLHLGEKSLDARTVCKRGELYTSGLCSSGLTIRQCLRNVRDTRVIADRVILLVGAVDILQRADLANMKSDMLDLIEILESRVSSLVVLTVPPLVNTCHLENWQSLKRFNKWLRRMDTGYKLQVIDTWPLLRHEKMYDYYEHFPRRTIHGSAYIVLWNRLGRKSVTKFLKKKIFL